MTRRSFLDALTVSSATAAWGAPFQERETPAAVGVSILVNSKNSLAAVPENYNGLSYESRQLADPGFLRPQTKG